MQMWTETNGVRKLMGLEDLFDAASRIERRE